jgi:hypothetical protein
VTTKISSRLHFLEVSCALFRPTIVVDVTFRDRAIFYMINTVK